MSNKVTPEAEKSAKPSSEDLSLDSKIDSKELEQIMSEIDDLQEKMTAMPDPGLDLNPEALLEDDAAIGVAGGTTPAATAPTSVPASAPTPAPKQNVSAPVQTSASASAPAESRPAASRPQSSLQLVNPTQNTPASVAPAPKQSSGKQSGSFSSSGDSSSAGSVSMDLQGQITICLRHEGGDEVTVRFTPEGIHLETGDGMEFRIPARQSNLKKVP